MSEHSIAAARASVMLYNDSLQKWVPSGNTQGLSKVHIYHHSVNNTFRVVGRKIQDHEVVINCAVLKGLRYNQATTTFHQWRDNRQVYGLNFACREDAETFATAMTTAIESLNDYAHRQIPAAQPMAPPTAYAQPLQSAQPVTNGNGYGSIEDHPISTTPNSHEPKVTTPTASLPTNNAPQPTATVIPPAPPLPPAAPQAPPAPPPPPAPAPAAVPPAPPPPPPAGAAPRPPTANIPPPPGPPPPPVGGGPPPPPPPPPPPMAKAKAPPGGSLADQLAAKKLRNTDSATTSPASKGSSVGPPGGPPGDFLAELMQKQRNKTLNRNRGASQDKNDHASDNDSNRGSRESSLTRKKNETSPTNGNSLERSKQNGNFNLKNGQDSPKPLRKNFRSREDGLNLLVNGSGESVTSAELEKVKQEILTEMRMEMSKMKEDIIQAIREMGRN